LPKTGTLATGNFDLAYVPFTMGADPDDSDVLACGAPSNYMHWCDKQSTPLNPRRSPLFRKPSAEASMARSHGASPIRYPCSICLTHATSTRMTIGCMAS